MSAFSTKKTQTGQANDFRIIVPDYDNEDHREVAMLIRTQLEDASVVCKQVSGSDPTYDSVKSCKSAVRTIIDTNVESSSVVNREIAYRLSQGRSFDCIDYYLLWLYGRHLTPQNPDEDFQMVYSLLVKIVNINDSCVVGSDVRQELRGFAGEVIESILVVPEPMPLFKKNMTSGFPLRKLDVDNIRKLKDFMLSNRSHFAYSDSDQKYTFTIP